MGHTQGTLEARAAAGLALGGPYVMTASHEGKRSGVVARSLAWAADEPPLVAVFVRRGHWIEPVIRDSRRFAVSRVDSPESPTAALMMKRFAETSRPKDGDPFDGIESVTVYTGAPALARSSVVVDCEVHRHFDLDADHELYLGLVRAVRLNGEVAVLEVKPPPARP
jgi:flavin reductase (DIM6/NTAB) family NADH-FMN oxidoreductase RutF